MHISIPFLCIEAILLAWKRVSGIALGIMANQSKLFLIFLFIPWIGLGVK